VLIASSRAPAGVTRAISGGVFVVASEKRQIP